ncbi:hypothetical protein ScPMuIL_000184 [Solemya velum]
MCGEISMTSSDGCGSQANLKAGQTKISMTSGDGCGSQANLKAGQTKVPAPISPGRIGAAPSKVVTGLKRAAKFSVAYIKHGTRRTAHLVCYNYANYYSRLYLNARYLATY